jgi:hypothetical protein
MVHPAPGNECKLTFWFPTYRYVLGYTNTILGIPIRRECLSRDQVTISAVFCHQLRVRPTLYDLSILHD